MNKIFKEFKKSLISHLEMYPLMQPEDVYKLAFQFTYGPGHFFIDEDDARRRMFKEAEGLEAENNVIEIEAVGNGYFRYPLIDNPVYLNMIADSFIATVKAGPQNNVDFKGLLMDIISYIKDLKTDFEFKDFLLFIQKMQKENFPIVSHSEKYREAYNPHYRVIKQNL